MNIINETGIIFTNRRSSCCWGACIGNPLFACCNSCPTGGQINERQKAEGQKGNQYIPNYGINTELDEGSEGTDQGDYGNTQNFRKREWMSDTKQLY